MTASRFEIRVPGSTSNLGPGFDCLGMAVDRHLSLTWVEGGGAGLSIEGERPPPGFGDRLAGGLDALSLPDDGSLHVASAIPVGRGLGSSAALAVALAALRRFREGAPIERVELLREVAELEGHPDNAAPAVFGGLVAARLADAGVSSVPLPLSARIGWVWAGPSRPSDTRAMRAALPDRVDHAAAVRNAARLAHLVPALAAGDGATLAWAMEDELHVPMRLPRIVGAAEVRDAALEAGAWACTISGAGSGLIAAAPRDSTAAVVEAMRTRFRSVDPDPDRVHAFEVRPDLEGAVWGEGLSPSPGRVDEPQIRRG